MKILTDGDSFATRWKVEKAWPDYIKEHYNVSVSNYGVAGSSNKEILERLRNNVPKESPDIILVILSYQLRDYRHPNQSPYEWVSGNRYWTPRQYITDYFQHINEIISMCDNVLIMQGIPNEGHHINSITGKLSSKVHEEIRFEWELQKKNCNATSDNFIDFGDCVYYHLYENQMIIPEYMNDHGHPTEEGHKYIAQRFINELDKKNLF